MPVVPHGSLSFIAPTSLKVRASHTFHSHVADKLWRKAVKEILPALATSCPACSHPEFPFVPANVVRLVVSACAVSHELSPFPAVWTSANTAKNSQLITSDSKIVVWPGFDSESLSRQLFTF